MAGVKLSEIREGTRTIPIPFAGLTFNVTYRIGQVSEQWVRSLFADGADPELIPLIVDLLESWELQNDDGSVIPITIEALEAASIPAPLLRAIFRYVTGDGGVGEVESSSDAG